MAIGISEFYFLTPKNEFTEIFFRFGNHQPSRQMSFNMLKLKAT